MSDLKVILVARNETRILAYSEALAGLGVACHPLLDIRQVPHVASSSSFNGIMLDMPVIAKASVYEKELVENVINTIPSAYLNIMPATDMIKLLVASGNHGTASNLQGFVDICRSFPARYVRPNDRVSLHLNALILNHDLPDLPEKSVTLNVSPKGCFLFSSNINNKRGQTITAEFIGLEDTSEILAIVRWVRCWGEVHQMPGIGVSFERISESQTQQLAEFMAKIKS